MTSHPGKLGIHASLLMIAMFGGIGCSQSPDLSPTASAQTIRAETASVPAPVSQSGLDHSFVFKTDQKVKSVSLVGSFNNWNKTANPMKLDADGMTWRLNLPLTPGRYVYKFVQFAADDAETWVVDPHAPRDEMDKANDNSLLIVSPAGYQAPASPNDGVTAASALFHPHGVRDLSYDAGAIELSLRARPHDLSQIFVVSLGKKYPMKLVRNEEFYAYYSAKVPWNRQQDLTYHFELQDGKRVQQLGADGLSSNPRPFKISSKGFQPYLLSNSSQPLKMKGPLTTQNVAGPAWAKNQPIYEVNLDAYKFAPGTALREYEKHLPVLKEIGVGILWFMPLYPRGHIKGFGSPYSVRDYTDINPDLGTKADFKQLVESAHKLGLRVVMDWVPNHTSWDNSMIEAHPEWYVKNAQGEISQAFDWADTAQLDYGQPNHWNQPLWNQMRDNVTTWVRDFGVDGFRADVAGSNGKVPVEFWNWLRPQLDAIKPVFMLAEADDANLHPAFDMTYSWSLPPVLWDITAGRKPASAIDDELRKEALKFPTGAISMHFLDNHDWHPHADWDWGKRPVIDAQNGLPQVAPLMVLCATLPGKPLIYNGQEMSFVKVDPSSDADARTRSAVWPFYRGLMELYQSQPAIFEGDFSKITSDHDDKIYAFTRESGKDRVLVVVNLTDQPQTATLKSATLAGRYRDWFDKADVNLAASPVLNLAPWAYRVYVQSAK